MGEVCGFGSPLAASLDGWTGLWGGQGGGVGPSCCFDKHALRHVDFTFTPFLFWKGFLYAATCIVEPVSFYLDYAASRTSSEIHTPYAYFDSSVSIE